MGYGGNLVLLIEEVQYKSLFPTLGLKPGRSK